MSNNDDDFTEVEQAFIQDSEEAEQAILDAWDASPPAIDLDSPLGKKLVELGYVEGKPITNSLAIFTHGESE